MLGKAGPVARSIERFALGVAAALAVQACWSGSATAQPGAVSALGSDWTGVWVFQGGPLDVQFENFVFTPGRLPEGVDSVYPPEPMPKLKGKYLEMLHAKEKALRAGDPVDDSGAACTPQGMPRFWLGPYAFELVHSPKQINLFQEWNEQTRRIYLDGRPHPREADPTYNGHSVGHWEGAVLVVDTANIRPDTGIGQQDQAEHSGAIRVTERFTKTGADELTVSVKVEDPEAFVEPWFADYRLRRKAGMEIAEYRCNENNRNPVGPDGRTQTLMKK